MKPLFTVHAGEYLVGSYIEKNFPKWRVWVPAKDTGIDLLITNHPNTRAVSLQVKFSKDFNPTNQANVLQDKLRATGWWRHQAKKIKASKADFWVFVLPSFMEHETSFIIIPPADLLPRLRSIHEGCERTIHSYFSVTKTGRCWETRGLNKADLDLIASDRFRNTCRDFTLSLNAWHQIQKRL